MEVLFFIGGILVAGIILILFIYHRRKKFSKGDREWFLLKWREIQSLTHRDPKLAIIEADKLLEWALSKKGFEGSLGEKLKKATPFFSDIDGLWRAHKKRNELVHEVSAAITEHEASLLLSIFRKSLHDLGL